MMKLTTEKEKLVLENQKFVHYMLQKEGIFQNSPEYDDLFQVGNIGLIKAAITYDETKKVLFASYASTCIRNEIYMYFRKSKKYKKDISFDEPINEEDEGNILTIGDLIEHEDSFFVDKYITKEEFCRVMNLVLNYLKGRERAVLLYRLSEVTQIRISKKQNISQSYISRIEKKAIRHIKEFDENNNYYKEVFTMTATGDTYNISFSSKDIKEFNKIFAKFLQNITSISEIPDFTVDCNKERIVIRVPADLESFSFIAEIIQEIDNFIIKFESDKRKVHLKENVQKKPGLNDKDVDSKKSEEIEPDSTEENDVEYIQPAKPRGKRGEGVRRVREYMLKKDYFYVEELKKEFPELSDSTIRNAIQLTKSKGLIKSIERGKYAVIIKT